MGRNPPEHSISSISRSRHHAFVERASCEPGNTLDFRWQQSNYRPEMADLMGVKGRAPSRGVAEG
jgi:hypothetical protein